MEDFCLIKLYPMSNRVIAGTSNQSWKSLTRCLGNLEQPADGLADDPADGGHLGEGLGRAELALHQHREDV